ncbi:C40 family peptidase [Kitasatospora sp. DSM 101779]|uniref:C40 family peptidase n=1 Tax=Kitasatospora sp. DSM 101779 TaxID=2853165 RepID=UPI0021D86139|nr:C40 family peptidase [Kitasatospora sp. DSM 101779]MCU7826326.1 C40 family peptidase [Kitasatospora sp. DSM 101779]
MTADDFVARLPAAFWRVPYAGARFPGSRAVAERPGLEHGANCQQFARAVLERSGLLVPALRSSELWTDTASTVRVSEPAALDLLFFGRNEDPRGAHIGVCAGGDTVLHLCAEVGRPVLWSLADFAARERYRVPLGAKRVTARVPAPAAADRAAAADW